MISKNIENGINLDSRNYRNDYLIVTVAKNEGKVIENTIKSIINQSVLPMYYIIVDDGSTDSTSAIINRYSKEYPWIIYTQLTESNWDIGAHYAYICKFGFETAIGLCSKNHTIPKYIALIDADTMIEKRYFEKIFDKFYEDENLGIISGGVYHDINGKFICQKTRLDFPRGTGRCWRFECFQDTEGYVVDVYPDYMSNIRAKGAGWSIIQCPEILSVEQRPTGLMYSDWVGNVKKGANDYHIYLNPMLVIAKFFMLLVNYKNISVIGYCYGYLSSLIRRRSIISNKFIRRHCMVVAVKERLSIIFQTSIKNNGPDTFMKNDYVMQDDDRIYFEKISIDRSA